MKQISHKQRKDLCYRIFNIIRIRPIWYNISWSVYAWNMKEVLTPYYRMADNATVDEIL